MSDGMLTMQPIETPSGGSGLGMTILKGLGIAAAGTGLFCGGYWVRGRRLRQAQISESDTSAKSSGESGGTFDYLNNVE